MRDVPNSYSGYRTQPGKLSARNQPLCEPPPEAQLPSCRRRLPVQPIPPPRREGLGWSPGSPGDQLDHFSQAASLSWASRSLCIRTLPHRLSSPACPRALCPMPKPVTALGPTHLFEDTLGTPQEHCAGFGSGSPELRPHILPPSGRSPIVPPCRAAVPPVRRGWGVTRGHRVKCAVSAGALVASLHSLTNVSSLWVWPERRSGVRAIVGGQ